jgi:hypothetical protein
MLSQRKSRPPQGSPTQGRDWWEDHFEESSSDFGDDFLGLVPQGDSPTNPSIPTWLAALLAIIGVGILVEFGHAKVRELK